MAKLEEPIELFELIGKVRTDLEAARTEGQDRGIRFELETVELELRVVAKRIGKGEAGVKLHVLNIGGGRQSERENAQIIRVRMKPVGSAGGSVQVNSESAERPQLPEPVPSGS
ncbi:MAG: hypothetical protein JW751_22225 [Polyangiaceae bacterium]|nr:hypothetical protein [Polyangiaceae bacterium]